VDSTKIAIAGALPVAESHCIVVVALSVSDKVESGVKLHRCAFRVHRSERGMWSGADCGFGSGTSELFWACSPQGF